MLQSIRNFFSPIDPQYRLAVTPVCNLTEYQAHAAMNVTEYKKRWELELGLAASGSEFETAGFCYPCNKNVLFKTDFQYGSTLANGTKVPNWRERVLCPECQMNNRTRASIQILGETLGAKKSSTIYIAEQVTPLYVALKKRFPKIIGSEYIGDKIDFGQCDERGVRNESITKLTFADDEFDFILNFDVLEHVPDVSSGLKEIYRTLANNGTLLLSVPFLPGEQSTRTRARINNLGEIEHLLEPQYHGDPIADAGCLCFQDFGWDLLDQMRSVGFTEVSILFYWSAALGYYGVEQMMIVGRKSS